MRKKNLLLRKNYLSCQSVLPQVSLGHFIHNENKISEYTQGVTKQAAIGIIFVPGVQKIKQNQPPSARIILTKRSLNLSQYPGQISFPGGRKDSNEDTPFKTAVREIHEEISLQQSDLKYLATLLPMTALDGSSVWPVVFQADILPEKYLRANSEVEKILLVSWKEFQRSKSKEVQVVSTAMQSPSFTTKCGQLVWGLTARILWELDMSESLVISR